VGQTGTDYSQSFYAKIGSSVSLRAFAPAIGKHFVEWTAASPLIFGTASAAETTFRMPQDDVVVTANFGVNTYKLTLDPEHGTVSPRSKMVTYGSKIGALPVPKRSGYKFNYWRLGSGERVSAQTVYKFLHDEVLYAFWSKVNTGVISKIITPYAARTIYVKDEKLLNLPFEVVGSGKVSGLVRLSIFKQGVLHKVLMQKKVKVNKVQTFRIRGKKVGKTKIRIFIGSKQLTFTVKVVDSKTDLTSFRTLFNNSFKDGSAPQKVSLSGVTKKAKFYQLTVLYAPGRATNIIPKYSVAKRYRSYLTVDHAGRLFLKKVSKVAVPVVVKCAGVKQVVEVVVER
jgi:hypothetical protein